MKSTRGTAFWLVAAAVSLVITLGYAAMCARIDAAGFIFNDFALLNYSAEAARRFYANTGAAWGFDPHFMAGYPLTYIWNSNVAIQAAALLFDGRPAESVVRWCFLAGLFSFPFLYAWALANFGLSAGEISAGLVLGCLYFMAGLPVVFFMVGMVTAGFAVGVCMVALSFLYRWASRGGVYSFTGLLLFLPLSLFVHKTTALALAVPVIICIAVLAGRKPEPGMDNGSSDALKRIAGIALAGAAALAANWFWIGPMLSGMDNMVTVAEAPFWRNYDLLLPLKEYFTGVARMNLMDISGAKGIIHSVTLCILAVSGAAGFVILRRRGNGFAGVFLVASAAALWLFAYYGSFLPGAGNLNPTRYQSFAQLLLAAPGGVALARLTDDSGRIRPAGWAAASIVALASAGCMAYSSQWLRPLHILLERGAPPEVTALADRIKELPPGGRVMIEDSGDMDLEGMGQVYGNSQIVSNFGLMTGREFIGGPYPYVFLKHRHASFFDGRAFGRPISEIRPEEMKQLLELYDVNWIVCWSDSSKGYFQKYGGDYAAAGNVEQFSIYSVLDYSPSPFLSGSGTVESDYGILKVKTEKSHGGAAVIKYHWFDTFTTEPETKLEKFDAGGDPVGFIRIVDPPPELTISFP